MSIHMNAQQISTEAREGELDLRTLKKFIAFCRRLTSFSEKRNIIEKDFKK